MPRVWVQANEHEVGRLQVAVVLSEKVDTTLSKGVLRIGGTVVGGSLGEDLTALNLICPRSTAQVLTWPGAPQGCTAESAKILGWKEP